jgi:hypothetical protein
MKNALKCLFVMRLYPSDDVNLLIQIPQGNWGDCVKNIRKISRAIFRNPR